MSSGADYKNFFINTPFLSRSLHTEQIGGFYFDKMENSWIKIYRSINRHWIWENSDYLKWWLDILLEVNYTEAKTVIGRTVLICGRGEKLYSLDTWAKRWGTNKTKVRRFLKLLESDNMIVLKSETQTTRLTVCNYDSYQVERNADETQVKRKRNASETQVKPIEERKERKEGKEVNSASRKPSSFGELMGYCHDNGLNEAYAKKIWKFYEANNWTKRKGKNSDKRTPIKNWKLALKNTWFANAKDWDKVSKEGDEQMDEQSKYIMNLPYMKNRL